MDRSRGQANIIKRYLWLLETLSTHNRITYKEISDLWQRSYGMPLPHKTFEKSPHCGGRDIFSKNRVRPFNKRIFHSVMRHVGIGDPAA